MFFFNYAESQSIFYFGSILAFSMFINQVLSNLKVEWWLVSKAANQLSLVADKYDRNMCLQLVIFSC